MLPHVLLAISSETSRGRLRGLVKGTGARVSAVSTETRFWSRLSVDSIDLVIIDPRFLRTPLSDTVSTVQSLPDHPEVVTALMGTDTEERQEALGRGALAVLDLAQSDEDLAEAVGSVVDRCRTEAAQRLRIEQAEDPFHFADFVSASPAMRRLISMAKRVSVSDTSLLLLGESGVGKEWLARAIHEEGPRAQGPFIAVHLGAIPETLLESELFGHVEGAFTDARRAHRGYFELAHGGTVFLDEIAELPSHLQSKLLRILEDKSVRPLGGEKSRVVDVRIIAATNQDLDAEIEAKRFRADLYYRLGVVTLVIPPLRDRKEDIPELIQSYFQHYQVALRRRFSGIHPDAVEKLIAYSWPGNVRELMNVMERAVLLATGNEISVLDLPDEIARRAPEVGRPAKVRDPAPEHAGGDWWNRPWNEVLEDVIPGLERNYLERLLTGTGGRVDATARRAGISTRTLYQRMKRHGLRKEDFKP